MEEVVAMSSIDVVIPCYRYAQYLRASVRSVLDQAGVDLRILILDDESPDDTPAVAEALIREDERISYRRHTANLGHIATFNEGIAWTRAEYMLLLSADDYLLPGALQRAIALMDTDPTMGLCVGRALELRPDGSLHRPAMDVGPMRAETIVLSGADFVRWIVQSGSRNLVPSPTAVVRRSLLKRLGGYRADLPHAGDLEMWLRLAAHGPVGIVKADQAVYRRHAASMSNAYYGDNVLADLQQRKTAFDAFVLGCGAAMPEADHLYAQLLQPLAQEAVALASEAFNSRRTDMSRRLLDFAATVHPGVRDTLAWRLLACKKLMGHRISSALLPAVARLRSTTQRLRS
jgi:glycosyltransferase involved in cell wall biosynthesis